MRTSNYRGPAREFSDGDENFDIMHARALDFLDYLMLWDGYGGLKPEEIEKMNDQQARLGMARAMAIACEKNPLPEKNSGTNSDSQTDPPRSDPGRTTQT